MASEEEGPDFSYAYGGASWNPALRPATETSSTPVISSQSDEHEPHHGNANSPPTAGTTTVSEAVHASESHELPGAEPTSDDDFFERYGSGTLQKPPAPSGPVASQETNSMNYSTEADGTQQQQATGADNAPQGVSHAPSSGFELEEERPTSPEQSLRGQAEAQIENDGAIHQSSPPSSNDQTEGLMDRGAIMGSGEVSGLHLDTNEEGFQATPEQTELPPSNLAVPLVSPTHSHAPSEGYEYQGETTFLEDAVNEDAAAPLVSQSDVADIDWGTTGDALEIGEQEPGAAISEKNQHSEAFDIQTQEKEFEAHEGADLDWGGNDGQDLDFNIGSQEQSSNEFEAVGSRDAAEKRFDEAFASEGHDPADTTKETNSAAMWEALLEDDELLDDNEGADPASFFADDGEGFLNDGPNQTGGDSSNITTIQSSATNNASNNSKIRSASRYSPAVTQEPAQAPRNIYAPQGPSFTNLTQPERPGIARGHTTPYGAYGVYSQQTPYANPFQQQPSRPNPPTSTQSFVDKSKGGYASPYDLPEELKPKKRAVVPPPQPRAVQPTPPLPPPRSSSMSGTGFAGQLPQQAPPSNMSVASLSPPTSSRSAQPPTNAFPANGATIRPSQPASKPASSGFFEDLPVVAKPRQATGRFTPQTFAPLPPPPPQSVPPRSVTMPPPSQALPSQPPPMATQLHLPERLPPFPDAPPVAVPSQPAAFPQPVAPTRYSPAPVGAPAVQTANARYSPAPPTAPAAGPKYSPAPPGPTSVETSNNRYTAPGPPRAPAHSFVPRTSSPLAQPPVPRQQQESRSLPGSSTMPESDGLVSSDSRRRSSRQLRHESSIPEVDEPIQPFGDGGMMPQQKPATPPPPRSGPPSAVTSPRKQLQMTQSPTKYAPQYQPMSAAADPAFVPPRRSQTQSPGATRHVSKQAPTTVIERPASAFSPSPPVTSAPAQTINSVLPHRRGFSQEFNYVTPSDERGVDPLERWKGYPVFKWGLGGTILTTFPKHVPRYGGGQTGPVMKCVPGEVKLQHAKELCPVAESIAKFPGPLKKGKKKDLVSWLNAQIEAMKNNDQSLTSQDTPSQTDSKRSTERVLLWKIVLTMVEHDGVLEGSPAVEQAVRNVLSPAVEASPDTDTTFATGADLVGPAKAGASGLQAEAVDPVAVEQLRKFLAKGEREPAVWHAVDQRLWAHAMLISSTLNKDIWKQVVQEFVRKEVKMSSGDNAALAALYQVFAGNWEDSIDELVPVSARAGFQMVSKAEGVGITKNALEGLDQWRETLVLILNNRSAGDAQAVLSLGKMLAGYGRIEAAHICYLFARSVAYFGGADDPQSHFTLVGADHTSAPLDLSRNTDSILLSEIYEFALSLAMPAASAVPHLQAYKLSHAYTLAEYGYRNEAQQYCGAIADAISSKTRASPYYNVHLIGQLDDLSKRLSQSPTDTSSSWISKPTMGKVSSSLWGKFNTFVAGDESDAASTGSAHGAGNDVGPFAKIAGDTPTISRSASNTDLYSSYPTTVPALSSSFPSGNSKYAPVSNYAPRKAQEMNRTVSAYQPSRPSLESNHSTHSLQGLSANVHGRSEAPQPQRYTSDSFAAASTYAPRPAQAPDALGVSMSSETEAATVYPSYSASPYQPTPPPEAAATFSGYQPPESHVEQQSSLSVNEPPVSDLGNEYTPPQTSYEPPETIREPPTSAFEHPSNSYEPFTSSGEAPTNSHEPQTSSYEPPTSSYEPPTSSYEPPTYQPYEPEPDNDDEGKEEPAAPKKKKGFMDDDEDDTGELARRAAALKAAEKAKADREADEAFRKAAEADAAKPASEKKGWFGGWFKKDAGAMPGPVKAKLGEESSFYYDTDLKKWVNKKAGATAAAGPAATPPPPKGPPSRSVSAVNLATAAATPPLGPGSMPPLAKPPPGAMPARSASNPPMAFAPPSGPPSRIGTPAGGESPVLTATAGLMPPGGPSSAPPSRPPTSMSTASDIDDLLGAPGARKGGTIKKGKRAGRYVDVMAAK